MVKVYFKTYKGNDYFFDPVTRKIAPAQEPASKRIPWNGTTIFKEMTIPSKDYVHKAVNHHQRMLQLNITENCSNRCTYCVYSGAYIYERSHSSKQMPFETAQKAIDSFFIHSSEEKEIPHISFYGGEPLMEESVGLLYQICGYAKKVFGNKITFGLTTNGRHLNPETTAFLVNNDFRVLVSMDGPQEIHDRYRKSIDGKPTFDEIMLSLTRISENYPEWYKTVGFICVLVPPLQIESIKEFFNIHPLVKGHTLLISFVNFFDQNLKIEYNEQKFFLESLEMYRAAFQEYYKNACASTLHLCTFQKALLGKSLGLLHLSQKEKGELSIGLNGCCIPGQRRCFVNTDGNIYSCEKVAGFNAIGNVTSFINTDLTYQLMEHYRLISQEDCLNCWCANICDLCYYSARKGETLDRERKKTACAERREFFKAIIRLYASLKESFDKKRLNQIMPSIYG